MDPQRSKLSRFWTGFLVTGLRAVGLRQAAAKVGDSLQRRRFGDVLETVSERCFAYMKSLGPARGLVTYVRCMYPRRRRGMLIQVRTPELAWPLTLRATPPDVRVFEQVYVDRLHEVDVSWNPKLIVDAGAHIGCVTAALAAKFPQSTILAVEPDIENYDLLCRNMTPYRNVIPIRAAVWHQPAVLLISNPQSESWTFQMRQLSQGEAGTTLGLTLAELLKWSGMDIDILKLDVEGAEREIFSTAGSEGWLEHVRQIRVELHDRTVPGCEHAMEEAIAGPGHRFSRSTSGEYTILQRIG